MIVKDSFQGLKDRFRRIVVGLGNFDGVHIGHQKLITKVVNTARSIGGTAVIFTFNPHPMAVLNPQDDPPKLTTQQAKEKLMGGLGVDVILSVPFTSNFAKLTPEQFIKEVLVDELAVKSVVVGYNYTFGNRGLGNPDTLKMFSEEYGYNVEVIPPISIDGQVVSSTIIRRLIFEGDVETARKFLGHAPYVDGIVVTGDRRGNTIGFPTANLNFDQGMVIPAKGVYSVHVAINRDTHLGVANVGIKPTFNGAGGKINLEVHLLDFVGDIYGKMITVSFIRRLRSEKRFNSVQELVSQIQLDIEKALVDRI